MDLRDNIRLNRTKMLDEAAINHRPSHFMHTLLIFLLVYFIANLAISMITAIPTAIYLLTLDSFWDLITSVLNETITDEAFNVAIEQITVNMPWWVTLVSLLASGGVLIGASIIYCKLIEKRPIKTLGLRKTNYGLEYGVGALIGVGMYALTFLIAFACGSVKIVDGASFTFPIILFLLAFVIQGAGEEIFVRGYLMTTVARDYKVGLALAFSSAVFALMHGANSGVGILALVNIFLFGVFEGIYILKRGDIIGACAIHTMWNFTQGCIFGSSVSGIGAMPSIFNTVFDPERTAANGGTFGLEGGFAATIVLLVAIGAILLVKPKQSELPLYELNRDTQNETIEF